ncbi:hypothetical protein V7V80_04165 [Pseudomonas kermanshahensis]|uniref:Class I SAM-dependent methyltransferase n=1 Tax=Pseudomonas kermanshahensis TaxID=2745482 RepID=A0ABU8R1W5_9PSED|nr:MULTISPECIES: hypothetical protein [Pseudomonas]ATP44194.1 hypothetical protein CR511_09080 [Pseudomonas putida]ATP51096.1 hypothetical protein CR512_17710 [Pseudomonas putida]MBC3485926.1 hypothetical protein [Pseudomonas sp. SWRI50]MBC3497086.1 hypothetical protein [Pseudomonas sp. SWRI67]MBV4527791.1 hypothetical protein [Pseudomonas kermanshahensis]
MSCPRSPRTSVCLSPLPANEASRTPRILLGGQHQPTLLRHLEGLSRRKGQARAFLIQFTETCCHLAQYGNDRFDLAVIQAPASAEAAEVIGHLTRIARQGLITRR